MRRSSDGRSWEYLLLRRTPEREGFWQGVTGALEPGEGFEQAARRELLEETGFIPDGLVKIDYSYSFPVADSWRHHHAPNVTEITEHVFLAILDSREEPRIDPREHDRWVWCSFEEALKKLCWPGNIEALKRCKEVLKARFAKKG